LTETRGDENVAAIVVPIVIVVILIIVAIAIAIAWILYRRKRSSKSTLTGIFKPEPVYDNVSHVHSSNGSGHVHIVDDYEYQTTLSCIDDNRHSANLDDVYLEHKATDQEGHV